MNSWQALLNELNSGVLELEAARNLVIGKIERNESWPGETAARLEVLEVMQA